MPRRRARPPGSPYDHAIEEIREAQREKLTEAGREVHCPDCGARLIVEVRTSRRGDIDRPIEIPTYILRHA